MKLRIAALAGILLLSGGCMYTPEGKLPQDIWLVNAPIDKAANCVMRGLDAAMVNTINRANDITHHVKVIEAGRLYEIRQNGAVSPYSVQLIKIDSSTTKALLQAPPARGGLLSAAVERCAEARKFIRYGT
jgi:flavin-binding protein dodecin